MPSSSYTGKMPSASAAQASRDKIEQATHGRKQTFEHKVRQVVRYINTAAIKLNISPLNVPCPSAEEWERLSTGYGQVLPSTTIMALYAPEGTSALLQQRGFSYRLLYWEEARLLIAAAAQKSRR